MSRTEQLVVLTVVIVWMLAIALLASYNPAAYCGQISPDTVPFTDPAS